MITAPQKARVLHAAQLCRSLGITQSQIASALGASQPQISRILKAQGSRKSRLFEEVCLYVERFAGGVTLENVRANQDLMEAMRATWDGSANHARALSEVIRSLAVLNRPASDKPTSDD